MSKNTLELLASSMACFAIGTAFGATLQERHDAKGLKELREQLKGILDNVKRKEYTEA